MYISRQLLYAMIYLHEKDVAHRDLKPSNILISNQMYRPGSSNWLHCKEWCQVKLADYDESRENIIETSSKMRTHTVNTFKGTTAFMAPEALERKAQLSEAELKQADI